MPDVAGLQGEIVWYSVRLVGHRTADVRRFPVNRLWGPVLCGIVQVAHPLYRRRELLGRPVGVGTPEVRRDGPEHRPFLRRRERLLTGHGSGD